MILITGAAGNTGRLVLQKIVERYPNKEVLCLTRQSKIMLKVINVNVFVEDCDLSDEHKVESIFQKYNNIELVINVANIKFSPYLMNLSEKYQVPHNILIHTTGVYSRYRSLTTLYKKIEEEITNTQYIHTSYTILRPTMIYGNIKDHNMHKLIKFLYSYPLFPIFGKGDSLMQPIHVSDLSEAILSCMFNDRVINEDFDLSGGSVISYKNIITLISNYLNKNVRCFHIPIWSALFGVHILKVLFMRKFISTEQIKRLQEDKVYSHEKANRYFGYTPRKFQEGIKEQIEEMRKEGLIK